LGDQPEETRTDDRLPRLHHWVIAAVTLFVMSIAVPLFAAFI
jgi:hypothetical protein